MELISCGYILHAYGIRLIAKADGKFHNVFLIRTWSSNLSDQFLI